MIHVLEDRRLAESEVISFIAAGHRYLVANLDGELHAFRVDGPAAHTADRASVIAGRVTCARHGWSIDRDTGRCGAADHCHYAEVPVEARNGQIRVHLIDV